MFRILWLLWNLTGISAVLLARCLSNVLFAPSDNLWEQSDGFATLRDLMIKCLIQLTHWGRVTHICVGNLTNIGSNNGLSPGRRQAITWTNVGILLIGPPGTYFSEMLVEIHTFSFKKIHLKMASAKWRPFCLSLNVLIQASVLRSKRFVLHVMLTPFQPHVSLYWRLLCGTLHRIYSKCFCM